MEISLENFELVDIGTYTWLTEFPLSPLSEISQLQKTL